MSEYNKYNNSFIYKIISLREDFDEAYTYYGSTAMTLQERMDCHRNLYRINALSCSSKKIFDKYGMDNCFIELIENCNCNDKYELKTIEKQYIIENNCINTNIPTNINAENKKEYNKEYYLQNIEDYKERDRIKYAKNKEEILEKKRLYYLKKKDDIREKQRLYKLKKKKEKNNL